VIHAMIFTAVFLVGAIIYFLVTVKWIPVEEREAFYDKNWWRRLTAFVLITFHTYCISHMVYLWETNVIGRILIENICFVYCFLPFLLWVDSTSVAVTDKKKSSEKAENTPENTEDSEIEKI
jgi:succinate dehydrogenase hydrophobic anchor subunit